MTRSVGTIWVKDFKQMVDVVAALVMKGFGFNCEESEGGWKIDLDGSF